MTPGTMKYVINLKNYKCEKLKKYEGALKKNKKICLFFLCALHELHLITILKCKNIF